MHVATSASVTRNKIEEQELPIPPIGQLQFLVFANSIGVATGNIRCRKPISCRLLLMAWFTAVDLRQPEAHKHKSEYDLNVNCHLGTSHVYRNILVDMDGRTDTHKI